MYRAPELFNQEVEMATDAGRRRRAKDRYDLASWLTAKREHTGPKERIALDRAVRTDPPGLVSDRDRVHGEDPVMRRISRDTVHNALKDMLDHDPAVLSARWPNGQLVVEIRLSEGARLFWNHESRSEPVTTTKTDGELAALMQREKLWNAEEIPERLREISLERQKPLSDRL